MATDHTSPNSELWRPQRFLSDDELAVYPDNFCGGLGSRFFPPVDLDSPVGSTEESNKEDDFIANLTQKVALSTFEDEFAPNNSKDLYPSGWPKSTLCGACGCGHASSRGIPTCATHTKPVQAPTLDVLCQVAGKVANMRLSHRQQQVDRARFLLQQQQRLDHLIHPHNSESHVSLYPNQAASQLSALEFDHLLALNNSRSKYTKTDTMSSSAWPTVQQLQHPRRLVHGNTNKNGGLAGMRAVFLGSSIGVRRGSTGTGVFLPRHVGPDPEPKQKQGCSTVLIPAKVVQTLNLNLDQVNIPLNGRNLGLQQQKESMLRGPPPAFHLEISLPSEWTY